MKLIYVASPYAGDIEENTRFAKQACRFVMNEGHAFIAPHLLYPQVLDDSNQSDREKGLEFGKKALAACDELWVFGETMSPGMCGEMAKAHESGIPMRYVTTQEMTAQKRPFAERHSLCTQQL